jgi:chromosome segregation ATPase
MEFDTNSMMFGTVVSVVSTFVVTAVLLRLKIEKRNLKKCRDRSSERLSLLNECRKELQDFQEMNVSQKKEILRFKSIDEKYNDKLHSIKDTLTAFKNKLEEQNERLQELESDKKKLVVELRNSYREIFNLKQELGKEEKGES